MGDVDVQIRKRKKSIDQIRSMCDVWKKVACADFRVMPWALRREMEQGQTEGNDTIPNNV